MRHESPRNLGAMSLGPGTSEDQCFLSTLLLTQLSVVTREKIFL